MVTATDSFFVGLQDRDMLQDIKEGAAELKEEYLSAGSKKALQEIGNPRQKMQLV